MCSRPLGSVSCTRSPARNGRTRRRRSRRHAAEGCRRGRRWPGSRPVRRPGRRRGTRCAGVRAQASSRSWPLEADAAARARSSSGRATSASCVHGRCSGGDGPDPRLVDDRGRPVGGVDQTSPRALACPHPAQRLGDRQVGRHEQARAQQRSTVDAGQPVQQRRRRLSDCAGPDPQVGGEQRR